MTSQHHPSGHDGESNPVKMAIIVTLGAVAVVIAIIMLANFAVSLYGSRDLKGDPSMSEQAVAKRIAPVAKVSVDTKSPVASSATAAPAAGAAAAPAPAAAPAAAPPPAAPAKVAAPAAGAGAGKSTYDSACAVCHAAGVAGAPKLGDKPAWAPRLAQGVPALHASALKGKGAMPPKGGNTSLSDDAVKAAVDFMLASAK